MKALIPAKPKEHNLINAYLTSLSSETRRAYKQDLDLFQSVINKGILEATEIDVSKYVKYLEAHYKNSTINRKLASVSKIMSVLVQQGLIDYSPIDRLRTTTKLSHKVDNACHIDITLDDVKTVIEYSDIRTGLIIETLCNTGLRISELCDITKTAVKLSGEYVYCSIKGKGNRPRTISISNDLYERITKVYNKDSDYVFHSVNGKRKSRQNVYVQINRSFKKYTNKDVSCHTMRHLFTTYHLQNKHTDIKAISEFLGHSDVQTTLRIYSHSQLKPEDTAIL